VVLLRCHGAVTDESIDALSRAVVVLQERIDGVESVNCRAVGSPCAAAVEDQHSAWLACSSDDQPSSGPQLVRGTAQRTSRGCEPGQGT
jgi:hypothetical protein